MKTARPPTHRTSEEPAESPIGNTAEFARAIGTIAGHKRPDKTIEITGVKTVIELAYELTHPDGTCALVGADRLGGAAPHVDIPRLTKLVAAGKLSFDGIITHEFPLAEINAALDLVRSRAAGRVAGESVGHSRSS